MKCPDCGVPLDEIPYEPCRYHKAYEEYEREALRREREARPLPQKIREAESFEELQEILAAYFEGGF